jgi:TPR repeat protein
MIPTITCNRYPESNMKFKNLRQVLAMSAAAAAIGVPFTAWASFAEGEEAYLTREYYGAFLKFAQLSKEGNAPAQAMLGRIYFEGQGAPRDYRTAAVHYEKAANQGNATAQYQLATLYAVGVGVTRDPARAAQWMEKSAEQGVLWAMVALGQMYKDGTGVAKDAVQALKWIGLAAASPETAATADYVKLAKSAKAELEPTMPADQVSASQKLAAQWNGARRTRDNDWQKAINRPLEVRASDVKPAETKTEKLDPDKAFTRDFYPGSK